MNSSVSILVFFFLSISALTLKVVASVDDTTKITTWQDAIQVLFVNPRGKPIEPSEALRLLRLAQGRTVGPFEVDVLLEFNDKNNETEQCTGQRFIDFDKAFLLSKEKAPTLDAYLRDCLKRQVSACKFEFNFKRALAKLLVSQSMVDIERLADLMKLDKPKLEPNEKNVGRNYDLQVIAVALRDLVNRYQEEGSAGGESQFTSEPKHKSREILLETVTKLETQLTKFNKIAHNLIGTLKDPSMLDDQLIARYYKILQIYHAVKNESESLMDRVNTLLLDQEANKGDDKGVVEVLKGFLG